MADDLVNSSGRVPRGGVDDDAAWVESDVQGAEKEEDPSPFGSVSLGATGASAEPCSFMPIFGRSFGKGVQYSGNASLNL